MMRQYSTPYYVKDSNLVVVHTVVGSTPEYHLWKGSIGVHAGSIRKIPTMPM